jgi:hypothetical protein
MPRRRTHFRDGRRSRVLQHRPKVWFRGVLYPKQTFVWPNFVLPQACTSPLSRDCSTLQISAQWAIACFKPTYHRLRSMYGFNYEAIVNAIVQQLVPQCSMPPQRGAELELHRRISLAVAALMNREGVPVQYPSTARYPRPQQAATITQPWLRALLTGWF